MRIRLFLKLMIPILLLYGIFLAFFHFVTANYFNVSKVTVVLQGTNPDLLKDLQTNLKKTLEGKNIWYISTTQLESILSSDVRTSFVKVKKAYPDEITVDIKTTLPIGYVQFQGSPNWYVINSDGDVFARKTDYSNLNLLEYYVSTVDQIKEALIVETYLTPEEQAEITKINVNQNLVSLYFSNGLLLKTDNFVEKDKYGVVMKLYTKLKDQKKSVAYIDIRFKDYIVKE